MPSKTKKQAKFMAAVANSPKFAKKAGVPQSVGKEFAKADKGKTFKEGGMPSKAHAKRVMRNLDDEDYRIRNRTGSNTDAERRRINREKEYEATRMAKGGKVKKQGYNARQDESLGSRNKTKGQQNLKSRRDEAQAMEKKGKKRKYSDVSTMDKGRKKKFNMGGKVSCDGVAQRGLTKIARKRG